MTFKTRLLAATLRAGSPCEALLRALALILACQPVFAGQTKVVTAAALAENVDAYLGQSVRVRRMHCADVQAGFLCRTRSQPNAFLKIDALALGMVTSDIAADRLARCKGEAALSKAACVFDVDILPVSSVAGVEDGVDVTTVRAREIDVR